jgi:subtilisin family serine protease
VKAWAEFNEEGVEEPGSGAHDSADHGTHCAGTIVGGNASGQWIGVAPEAKVAAALVLNGGHGSDAQILAGLDWAIKQDVDIINMSLGGLVLDLEVPHTYHTAFAVAATHGIPVVVSVGNEGNQTSKTCSLGRLRSLEKQARISATATAASTSCARSALPRSATTERSAR